jgi:hypothetical protein
MTAVDGAPVNEIWTSAFCTAIAATPSIPAKIALVALGSMRGPAATPKGKKTGKQQCLQQQERPKRGKPNGFQAARQQLRQAEHQHKHRDRQHRRDLRRFAADHMRSQNDQVAGDVSGKQSAKSNEADDVGASGDHAEHEREQPQPGRILYRRRRDTSGQPFSFRRHRARPSSPG